MPTPPPILSRLPPRVFRHDQNKRAHQGVSQTPDHRSQLRRPPFRRNGIHECPPGCPWYQLSDKYRANERECLRAAYSTVATNGSVLDTVDPYQSGHRIDSLVYQGIVGGGTRGVRETPRILMPAMFTKFEENDTLF